MKVVGRDYTFCRGKTAKSKVVDRKPMKVVGTFNSSFSVAKKPGFVLTQTRPFLLTQISQFVSTTIQNPTGSTGRARMGVSSLELV